MIFINFDVQGYLYETSPILEPGEIDVRILQGTEKTISVDLKNVWNRTIKGDIEVLNVECPYCARGHLDIDTIDLAPNETVTVKISIYAKRVKAEDMSLPILITANGNFSTRIYLNIDVVPNYYVWGLVSFFSLVFITSIIVSLFRWKKKKK